MVAAPALSTEVLKPLKIVCRTRLFVVCKASDRFIYWRPQLLYCGTDSQQAPKGCKYLKSSSQKQMQVKCTCQIENANIIHTYDLP